VIILCRTGTGEVLEDLFWDPSSFSPNGTPAANTQIANGLLSLPLFLWISMYEVHVVASPLAVAGNFHAGISCVVHLPALPSQEQGREDLSFIFRAGSAVLRTHPVSYRDDPFPDLNLASSELFLGLDLRMAWPISISRLELRLLIGYEAGFEASRSGAQPPPLTQPHHICKPSDVHRLQPPISE
jgi:hypothetical protein